MLTLRPAANSSASQLLAVVQVHGQVVAVLAHRDHAGAEDYLVSPRQEHLLEPPGDLAVHHRSEPGSAVEDGGVLDPDRAASHDQQLAWLAPDVHDGLGVEDTRVIEGHAGGPQRA